jgi:hypothetical protein
MSAERTRYDYLSFFERRLYIAHVQRERVKHRTTAIHAHPTNTAIFFSRTDGSTKELYRGPQIMMHGLQDGNVTMITRVQPVNRVPVA